MKYYMLMAVLASGLVVAGTAWAQKEESFEKEMQNIQLQNKQMDLQARQAEMEFQSEMRKLDLEKKRAELDKQREMMKMMPPQGPQMGKPGMPGGMPGCPRMGGPGMPGGCPCGSGINRPDGGRPQCPHMVGLAGRGGHPAGHHKPCMAIFILVTVIIHILLAVWVYQDIRKRNSGSRIWVVLALLAGLVGTLVYAIVRIGDNRQA